MGKLRHPTVGRFVADHAENDAGILIEPPISEPVASGVIPAASAAADPPEEPPGL